jgi:hypothetical protein
MLPLNDERWKNLEGGYRAKYDASVPLSRIENEPSAIGPIWDELWENLYHQGDVGIASYAAIPHIARIIRQRDLLDYSPVALAVSVELARGRGNNPPLPEWLETSYHDALLNIAEFACSKFMEEWNPYFLKSALSLLAIIKGNRNLGELIVEIDYGDERQLLDKYFEG